ncbi:hypothetical protein D3C87_378970 [compost metagenome]
MSSRSRYQAMFKSELFKNLPVNTQKEIAENIDWARSVLKKDDKIVWFLRIYKYNMMHAHQDFDDNSNSRLSIPDTENGRMARLPMSSSDVKWMKRFEIEHSDLKDELCDQEWRPGRDIETLKEDLEHFMNLNLNVINDTTLSNQSIASVCEIFTDIEVEWRERGGDRSVHEYGVEVLKTNDGYSWFDLQKSGCPVEGQSMRHCGNGYGHQGQNVYSLRSRDPDRDGYWIPHVTLIMNDHEKGITGEIKGYGNNKPDEKYWPSLVEFIKTDRVTKMVSGGYKPENNFSISDLSEDEQKSLISEKPTLLSAYQHWLLNDNKMNDHALASLSIELDENLDDNKMLVHSGSDVKELADTLKLQKLEAYSHHLISGFYEINDYHVSEDESIHAFEQLRNHDTIILLRNWLEINYAELIENCNFDISSDRDLVKIGKAIYELEDDELISNALASASNQSSESGTFSALYDAAERTLQGINSAIGEESLSYEHVGDHEWSLSITPQIMFEIFKENNGQDESYAHFSAQEIFDDVKDNIGEYIDFNDLNVPYYGFSGDDLEVFKEVLLDQLSESLSEFKKELENERTLVMKPIFDNQEARKSAQENFINKYLVSSNDLSR